MNITIKRLNTIPINIFHQFFYKAIFVPENQPPVPFENIYKPELYKYINAFGKKPNDTCVVGMVCAEIVGLAWARTFSDSEQSYGFINEDVPELCIYIKDKYRRRGLGKRLVKQMVYEIEKKGFSAIYVNVDKRNPAILFFKSLGFVPDHENSNEVVMIKTLNGSSAN